MFGPTMPRDNRAFLGQLASVLFAPRQSFEAFVGRERALDWFIPMLVACSVGIVTYLLTQALTADQTAAAARQAIEQLAPEERAKAEQALQTMRSFGWVMVPIGLFFSLVAVALVGLVLCRHVFRAQVTYRQVLIVKGCASLVAVPEWITRGVITVAVGPLHDLAGPGALVPRSLVGTYAGRVLQSLNLFDLWQVWIMGIGLAVMARVPAPRVRLALLALWGGWVLLAAIADPGGLPRPAVP